MIKINKLSLKNLQESYDHPSVALYRAIELRQIYEGCKKLNLKQPSLDIGSGDGKITSILFNEKLTYGVDNGEANDYQVAIDKKRYKKVLLESAEKMSIKDKSVNFVFSNSVLEHIPEIDSVFEEVSRVLKPTGYFIFTSPSKYFRKYISLNNKFNQIGLGIINRIYSKLRNKQLNHFNLYDHKYYSSHLKKYGLKVENYSYSIDKNTLELWEKMAIMSKVRNVLGKNNNKLTKSFKKRIENCYENNRINKTEGANLLIVAKRVNE